LYPVKLPEDNATVNVKLSEESAAKAVLGVGGIERLSKQKKAPLPSHPDEFKPPLLKLKPVGGDVTAADKKFAGVPNANAFIPERPPSVSPGEALMPVMLSVKVPVVVLRFAPVSV